MYGGGANKIAWQVTKDSRADNPNAPAYTKAEAEVVIKDYMGTFKGLAHWLATNQEYIQEKGFIYSFFGRKRRLPNVFSSDRTVAGHTVRSGINFLVQSNASDVNLLGGIDMQKYIEQTGMRARIFALVHDSILAEVPVDEIDHYCDKLREFITKDRGISIKGTPIGCDFEIGDDYSFDKYEKYEEYWDAKQ